jgi:hypothetical protein
VRFRAPLQLNNAAKITVPGRRSSASPRRHHAGDLLAEYAGGIGWLNKILLDHSHSNSTLSEANKYAAGIARTSRYC